MKVKRLSKEPGYDLREHVIVQLSSSEASLPLHAVSNRCYFVFLQIFVCVHPMLRFCNCLLVMKVKPRGFGYHSDNYVIARKSSGVEGHTTQWQARLFNEKSFYFFGYITFTYQYH